MPSPNEVLVKFRADASQLVSETQQVIDQLRIIGEVAQRRGGAGLTDQLRALQELGQVTRDDTTRVQELIQQLDKLRQLRLRAEGTSEGRTRISAGEKAELGLPTMRPRTGQIAAREAELAAVGQEELNQILDRRSQILASNQRLALADVDIANEFNAVKSQTLILEQQIARVTSGEAATDIVEARLAAIRQALDQVQAARTAIESQALQQLGRAAGGRIEQAQINAMRQLLDAKREIKNLDRQIASAESQMAQESTRGTTRQIQLQEHLNFLTEQRKNQIAILTRAERESGVRGAQIERAIDITGARGAYAELEALDARLEEQLIDTYQRGAAAAAPELAKIAQRLLELNNITGRTNEQERERIRLLEQQRRLRQEAPTRGIPDIITPQEIFDQPIAGLPRLERSLFTAFDDVGRRFRTAFQFALSGAFIFATQRLVREFFQAAIEVERTFADIESALEFDLGDEGIERGSAAFNRRVEEIRRNVLQLANDFNVLPSEANEAAFKMVARFGETENALKAVRAQFLATKISTIDQAEAIRALSATAEGFAAAVLETNSAMSLQERLLEREKVAAEGYGAALDEAVFIQQRFGVEVEDTLEGTARMAETFRQLGFSRQQTEAAVAAVSRTLGQTGVNVAERLNRAFGAITQPETRDAILELAAASDNLNLSLENFRTGADLVRTLDAQMGELEQREPQVALQLRDIIGQRRETEVVAAFFGTADLRRAIEASLSGAAGAAERRFGFLAQTVSEKILSIIAEFESLAQNFERLELFGPIKVFLSGLGLALSVINKLLQRLQDVVLFLDDIGSAIGLKLGTGLKNAVVIALSLLTTLRAAAAAIRVVSVARDIGTRVVARSAAGAAAGGAASGLLALITPALGSLAKTARDAGGGLKGAGTAAVAFGGNLVMAARHLVNWLGILLNSIPPVGRFSAAAGLGATAVGGLALGLLAAGALIHNFVSEGARAIQNMRKFEQTEFRAELDIRRRERAGERFTPEERAVVDLETQLADLRTQAEQGTRNFFATLGARILPIADEETRKALGTGEAFRRGLGLIVAPQESLIPLSEDWWAAQIKAAEDAFFQAQINEVAASLGQIQAERGDTRGGRGSRGGGLPPISSVGRELVKVQEQFAEADTDAERAEAIIALQRLLANHEEVVAELEETYGEMVESTTQLLAKSDELRRNLQMGRVSIVEAPQGFRDISDELRAHAAHLESILEDTPQNQELIQSVLEAADDALIDSIEARRAIFARDRSRFADIQSPTLRLQQELLSYQQELAFLRDEQDFLTQDQLDVMDQIANTQNELANVARQAALDSARRRVNLATTLTEWVAAMEELNKQLNATIETVAIISPHTGFTVGHQQDPNQIAEVADDIAANTNQMVERLNNEAVAVAEAQARLAGPIKSRLGQIEARIRGLQTRISQGFFSTGDALKAQVELAEAIADRIEAEAEAAAAWIRLHAGVGDSIRTLQAEMTIVTKQLEITAQLYGEQSAQFLQLKLAQDQLRNQMIEAQLELEDLNRRLGSDITNTFEQAQLDLVDIMRKLSQMDLGPLEEARLELEKKQAEASAEKAFFDDRLFQLRFDFETGDIGLDTYIASLQKLLENVDTSTQQGKEIFLEITNLIESLTEDVGELQFNIPSAIRMPTLFEVRRAVQAEQMGVNYQDNRQQTVTVQVQGATDVDRLIAAIDELMGTAAGREARRLPAGGAGIIPTWTS